MLIVGAKGFAKELLEVLIQADPGTEICFFDNVTPDIPALLYQRYPVISTTEELAIHFKNDPHFALGIGGTNTRKDLCELMIQHGGILKTVISPFARIGHFQNE